MSQIDQQPSPTTMSHHQYSGHPYGGGAPNNVDFQQQQHHQQYSGSGYASQQPQQQQFYKEASSGMSDFSQQPASATPVRGGAPMFVQQPASNPYNNGISNQNFPAYNHQDLTSVSSQQMKVQQQQPVPSFDSSGSKKVISDSGASVIGSIKTSTSVTETRTTTNRELTKSISTSNIGMKQTDETIFTTTLLLPVDGTLEEIINKEIKVMPQELDTLFKLQMKNIDRAVEKASPLMDRANFKRIFIGSVKVSRAFSTFENIPLALQATGTISDWNATKRPESSTDQIMLYILPWQQIQPVDNMILFDRLDVLKSRTFQLYGHITTNDIAADIRHPASSDPDYRQKVDVPENSPLMDVIIRNKDALKNDCNWDGKPKKKGGMIRLPVDVVASALAKYETEIEPVRQNAGVYDISDGLSFTLVPLHYSRANTLLTQGTGLTEKQLLDTKKTRGVVYVVLEIIYAFPQAANRPYEVTTPGTETAEQLFSQELEKRKNMYSSQK